MYTLAGVVSILREVHKSESYLYIFQKVCTYVHKLFSADLGQKKLEIILTVHWAFFRNNRFLSN